MRRIVLGAIFGAMLVAGVLTLLRGLELGGTSSFRGEMLLVQGRPQRLAVRLAPATRDSSEQQAGPVYFGVDGAAIATSYPELVPQLVQPGRYYDVLSMPFDVRLEEVPGHASPGLLYSLVVKSPEGEEIRAIRPDGDLVLDGEELAVEHIRPWSGLIRQADGLPMAQVSVRQTGADWTEYQFVHDGSWLRLEPGIGIRHAHFHSKEAMLEAVNRGLPGLESGRWGVAMGSEVHWTSSFLPGSALQPAEDLTATLVEYEPGRHFEGEKVGPAVHVEVRRGKDLRTVWCPANARSEDGMVRFEYFAALPTVFLISSWRDDHAFVTAYARGTPRGGHDLEAGELWQPKGVGYELRLDRVLSSAVAVLVRKTPVYEVTLRSKAGPRWWRFREGETARFGDVMVSLRCEAPAAVVPCALSFSYPDSDSRTTQILAPGDSVRFGGWTFSLVSSERRTEAHVRLAVEHEGVTPPMVIGVTVSLLGGLGLALLGVCSIWAVKHR